MASIDPAGHLAHPHTAVEQLDAIFTGNGPADYLLIAALAGQLLGEYHRIAGTPTVEWGVHYRYTHVEHTSPCVSEADARALLGDPTTRYHSIVHRHVIRRPDQVGPWIDGEPTAGAA